MADGRHPVDAQGEEWVPRRWPRSWGWPMARKAKRRRPRGMGTLWQRGEWWVVQWREKGRRKHAKFPDRDTAEKVLAKILSDVALNRHGIETEKAPSPLLSVLAKPWLATRKSTHRSWDADAGRWKLHLAPRFGKREPDEVDQAAIRLAVETWLAEGLTPSTCMRCVCLLSSLYTDLCERGLAKANPAKGLPRATRRLLKSAHDPKTTPFVREAGGRPAHLSRPARTREHRLCRRRHGRLEGGGASGASVGQRRPRAPAACRVRSKSRTARCSARRIWTPAWSPSWTASCRSCRPRSWQAVGWGW